MIIANREAKQYANPERLAEEYLKQYFKYASRTFPINPFQMLKDEGVVFIIKKFKKLEGLYIPASSETDIPLVAINFNRPIQRQRFTAAHELCHHLRDAHKQTACPTGRKDKVEIFADDFAAALLMPIDELRHQTELRKKPQSNYITFDDVLEIAEYFGVSFQSCLFRIAYHLHAIEGDIEKTALDKRAKKYKPNVHRKKLHLSSLNLYRQLVNSYSDILEFVPTEHSKRIFQSEYIYNDSRMEGLPVSLEEASEIVTDIRNHSQNSPYCNDENEVFLSIAGHYDMYEEIFSSPSENDRLIYKTLFSLNRKLFSYYPDPSFGGSIRQSNTLVQGAKFETVSYLDIPNKLVEEQLTLNEILSKRSQMTLCEYIEEVVSLHHRLTIIHPFGDGNGRTLRAFLNVLLVKESICPIYIKVEDKDEYLQALSLADTENDYSALFECIYKCLLKASMDLTTY